MHQCNCSFFCLLPNSQNRKKYSYWTSPTPPDWRWEVWVPIPLWARQCSQDLFLHWGYICKKLIVFLLLINRGKATEWPRIWSWPNQEGEGTRTTKITVDQSHWFIQESPDTRTRRSEFAQWSRDSKTEHVKWQYGINVIPWWVRRACIWFHTLKTVSHMCLVGAFSRTKSIFFTIFLWQYYIRQRFFITSSKIHCTILHVNKRLRLQTVMCKPPLLTSDILPQSITYPSCSSCFRPIYTLSFTPVRVATTYVLVNVNSFAELIITETHWRDWLNIQRCM